MLIYHHSFQCRPVCPASFLTTVCCSEFISRNSPPHHHHHHHPTPAVSLKLSPSLPIVFPLFPRLSNHRPDSFYASSIFHCCFAASVTVCFSLFLIVSLHVSLSCCSFSFSPSPLSLSVSLPPGRLQQQTSGGLIVSNGETLRSEGLSASQRQRANTTHKE